MREYCNLLYEVNNSVFTHDEILLIRTIITDLKSAPSLSEVPLNVVKNGGSSYQVKEGPLLITFTPISTIENKSYKHIRRIQILEISRIDLQLVDLQLYSV